MSKKKQKVSKSQFFFVVICYEMNEEDMTWWNYKYFKTV